MSEHVLVETKDGVLSITINRPEKKNALTGAMYRAIADAFNQANETPSVRVVTITGTGGSYTSGNDLNDFLATKPGEETGATVFLVALRNLKKPLIAGVNGLAVGVGVTMLLHCDLVYAAEGATFQLPFVNLGLVPEAASSLLLPRLVGHQRAAELLLLGEVFDTKTAYEIGFVNAVVSADALAATVEAAAAKLVAKPPSAVRATKALLKSGVATVPERMEEEGAHFAQQLQSPEAKEAMEAVLQRRKPDFSRFA